MRGFDKFQIPFDATTFVLSLSDKCPRLLLRGQWAESQVEAGEVSILDVVRAYARLRLRDDVDAPMELRRILAMTLTEALEALGQRFDELDEWTELFAWAGQSARGQGVSARSQAAASFVAALEMAKQGEVCIRQTETFGRMELARTGGAL